MPEINESIDQLQTRLEKLIESQEHFRREISQIRYEINVLRNVQQKRENLAQAAQPIKAETKEVPEIPDYVPPKESSPNFDREPKQNYQTNNPPDYSGQETLNQTNAQNPFLNYAQNRTAKSNVEKFIGENLISKIGIIILVIGVAIGAKYAIDNNLISPLARIVIG